MQRLFSAVPPDDGHAVDCVPVWFVDAGGEITGPLSSLQLAYAARHGLIPRASRIWRDGFDRWVAVVDVAGLLPPPAAKTNSAESAGRRLSPPDAVTPAIRTSTGASSFYDAYRRSLEVSRTVPRGEEVRGRHDAHALLPPRPLTTEPLAQAPPHRRAASGLAVHRHEDERSGRAPLLQACGTEATAWLRRPPTWALSTKSRRCRAPSRAALPTRLPGRSS